jgi:signal transduction histidine kinase
MTFIEESMISPGRANGAVPRAFEPTIVEHPGTAVLPTPTGCGLLANPDAALGTALLRVLGDFLFTVGKNGVIQEFRAPSDAEFPLVAEELVGRRILDLLPGTPGELAAHYLDRAFRQGMTQIFSCQYSFHGKTRIFEARITAFDAARALALVRDVTDRQTLENETIEHSHRVQLRLGQDLHDSLGQHLTGISFLSRALEKSLAAHAMPEAAEAAEVSKLVLEAISQTRQLARGLFPAELESHGLLPALKELASNIEESCGIACRLECEGPVVPVSSETAMHLFRLAQESVNNAIKHGKAQRVTLRLIHRDGEAMLRIEDDGVGFPAERPPGRGLGLRIMNYRAQKIGGTLDIKPGEHGGTVVACSFPAAVTAH